MHSTPRIGQPQPRRGSNNTHWLLAGAVIAAVAVTLVLLVVSQGEDDGAGGPEGAAEQLLEASKNQDLSAAQAVLCQDDLSSGFFTDELSSVQVVSYTINNVEEDGDISIVHATMQTTGETVDDAEIPVIQEGGTYKVCFQRLLDNLDTPTDLTIPETLRSPASG